MKATIHSLSKFVSFALEDYSDYHPNEVVNPMLIQCFVEYELYGKTYYYPIISIKEATVERRIYHDEKPRMINTAEIHINLYSFCQNPVGIKTKWTGKDMISLSMSSEECYCPQLNGIRLRPSTERAGEGILVFKAK